MTEIAEIYQDYLKMLEKKPSDFNNVEYITSYDGSGYFDEHLNAFTPTMRLFRLLLEKRGFLNKPKVVSNDEYENIFVPAVYHGFKERNHALAYLQGENFHLGSGKQLGTYYTENPNEANEYTKGKDKKEQTHILEAKVCSSNYESLASIIEMLYDIRQGEKEFFSVDEGYNKKIKELVDFCDREDREKGRFFLYMTGIPQILAVYLGIDYLTTQKGDNVHLCVFNRGCVVSSKENVKAFNNMKMGERV